jgi:RNA recognition motif-containing protein
MNGFGFIEYSNPMDARNVVLAFHGSNFMGERLVVNFARGSRRAEGLSDQQSDLEVDAP